MIRPFLKHLRKAEGGSTVVEFALAAPIAIALMTGVIQIGIAMQSYNALRGLSGDLARQTVVQYSIGVELTDQQIENDARARAIAAPYLLNNENLDINAVTADSSGIAEVKQIDVTISYNIRSIIPGIKDSSLPLSIEKSIFVIDEA